MKDLMDATDIAVNVASPSPQKSSYRHHIQKLPRKEDEGHVETLT